MNQEIPPKLKRSWTRTPGWTAFFTAGFCSLIVWGAVSCSSSQKDSGRVLFEESALPVSFKKLWKEEFPGPITDVAVARMSGDVLVATIPSLDNGGRHLLTLLNRSGDQVFRLPMDFPVKHIDVSATGDLVVVQNHEEQLFGLDRSGKKLWSIEASCKPIILTTVKKILCYHDDDTMPSFAFEVFGYDGKLEYKHSVKTDVLALKVSSDERWVALGISGGKLILMNNEFKVAADFKVEGEILDVSVSSGDEPRIAALSMDPKTGQRVGVYEKDGRFRGVMRPPYHVEQIELLPGGRLLALYGNSPKGQYIAAVSPHDLSIVWQKLEPRYADYSLSISVAEDKILAGFEAVGRKSRQSELLVLDLEGKLRSQLSLETTEGAYLYSFAFSPATSLLAIGSDDQVIQLYELK